MIELIHGRGQLGTALKDLIKNKKVDLKEDWFIYHTWNFIDKSENVQREEYEKFKEFVDKHKGVNILFISTLSENHTPYEHYKQLSEAYLLQNSDKGFIVRLSNLIGKGICERFKKGEAKPYGTLELMAVEEAAIRILKFLSSDKKLIHIKNLHGSKVDAGLAYNLIRFGK